jgi:protease YdgD
VQRVAVFGTDDRIAIPTKYQTVADRIGLLFNNRTRTVCTAFCVAPNVIATAAHCLFKPEAETPPRLAHYWFARGYDRQRDFSRIAGYSSNAASQNILTGATRLSTHPPIDAASDWALVRLTSAICQKGVLPIKPMPSAAIIKAAAERRIFQVAYHRDLAQWKPAYSQPCTVGRRFGPIDWPTIARDFTSPDQLILHTCDTGGASSGSPLLVDTAEGPTVIGINIGTYEQARVLVQAGQVTHRFKSETVANTGVNAAVFAAKVTLLSRAQIIASAPQIRDIQTALLKRGYYDGPIDGVFGPQLRHAIQAFEERERLPATGLPTADLARRLGVTTSPLAAEPRDTVIPPKPHMRLPTRTSPASLKKP